MGFSFNDNRIIYALGGASLFTIEAYDYATRRNYLSGTITLCLIFFGLSTINYAWLTATGIGVDK